jgi:uncharacterized protein (TIGR00369 family)
MTTLGAHLVHLGPGEATVELAPGPELGQHDGFVHAGVLTAIADSACGAAARTLMPPGSSVLSVEFKVNLLAPATAPRLVARARVVRAGRTLSVCQGEVVALEPGEERPVLLMQATMIRVGAGA